MPDAGFEAGETPVGEPAQGRSWTSAVWRGARRRCPECGVGAIFSGYTRTSETCAHCGLAISGHRADDAPPYVTILAVGHLAIPLLVAAKLLFDPPLGLQLAVSLPSVAALTLVLLPISKGALIGLQWANRMHGFADADDTSGRVSV